MDIGGTSVIRIIGEPNLKCELNFIKRGWLSKDEFKIEGDVFRTAGPKSKKKENEKLYRVHGNWNKNIYITKYVDGKLDEASKEIVFSKNPYPERWAYMYGMSHFSL